MGVKIILALSIVLQFSAAALALRLVRISGRGIAWMLITAAIVLMTIRRCISFYGLFTRDFINPPELAAEVVAFTISALIVLGLFLISPLFQDIRRSQEKQQESEEELNQFFNLSLDLLCVAGTDGYFKRINPAFEKILGYNHKELLSIPFVDRVHPEDLEGTYAEIEKLAANIPTIQFVNRYFARDGSIKWFEWTATSAENGLIYAAARDITERKQAEQALVRSEKIYRKTIENTDGVLYQLRFSDRHYTFMSPGIEKLTGVSPDAITKSLFGEMIEEAVIVDSSYPGDMKQYIQNFEDGCITQYQVDYRIRTADDRPLWINDCSILVRDELTGEITESLGILRDITDRKRSEQEQNQLLDRIRKQQSSVVALTTSHALLGEDTQAAAVAVIEAAANAMDVARISVWLLSEDHHELCCIDLFNQENQKHSAQTVLHADDYPNYFQALKSERAVAAHDAQTDTRTSEFTNDYLIPLNISSMLDATIRVSGKPAGVVCFEHVGTARKWTPDEIAFAGVIADQMAQFLIQRERQQAEQERSEALEKFEQIANHVHDCFWNSQIQEDGNPLVKYVSPGWKRIWGYEPQELYENPTLWIEVVLPEDRDVAEQTFTNVLNGQGPKTARYRIRNKQGEIRWIEDTMSAMADSTGKVLALNGIARDITARKQAEEEQRKLKRRYQTLAEVSPVGIYHTDPDGNCLYVNEEWSRITGLSSEEASETGWSRALHPEDRDRVFQEWNEAVQKGASFKSEYRFKHPDGNISWVYGQAAQEKDETGNILGFVGAITDITEHKKTEKAIAEAHALLEKTFESLSDALFIVTPEDRTIVSCNSAVEQVFGYDPGELIGRKTAILYKDQGSYTEIGERIYRELDAGNQFRCEYQMRRKDGTVFDTEHVITAIRDERGNRTGLVSLIRDISLRKQTEKQLRLITDSLPVLISHVGNDQCYQFNNAAYERWFHLNREDLKGRHLRDHLGEEGYERIRDYIDQALQGREVEYESQLQQPDGSVLSFHANYIPHIDSHGNVQGFYGLVSDVTEQKRIEQALKQSEQESIALRNQLLEAIESLTEAFALYDAEDRLVLCNSKYHEVYAESADLLIPGAKFEEHIRESVSRGQIADAIGREEEWIRERVEQHRNPQGSYLQQLGNGRWLLTTEQKTLDGGIVGVRTDITEQKQAELDREQLISELEAQNAELERFTYTVSHDLKSPLVTIKGFLGVLKQDIDQKNPAAVKDDIDEISQAASQMKRLLDELLELSRVGRIANPSENVPLSDVVQDVQKLLAADISEHGVKITIASELPTVWGDRIRLMEVLQNLLENAIKFRSGDDLRIEIGATQQGDETVCYVKDNGIGIDPKHKEKVFGLFEKLNAQSEGTGIGLALAKRIIEFHGGRIWGESDGLEKGCTFFFSLPNTNECTKL